jgi:hypothetical protein
MSLDHERYRPHQDNFQGHDQDDKLRPQAAAKKLEYPQRQVPEKTP